MERKTKRYNLFFDLESIPSQLPWVKEEIAKDISPPGNMSKAETITKWEEEKKPGVIDEAWRRTALDPTYGELLTFGFAVNGNAVTVISRTLEQPESHLLESINDILKNGTYFMIGHNISGFDLRFLYLRYVINGITPAFDIPYDATPWDGKIFDTMHHWKGGSNSQVSGSLSKIMRVLGIEPTTECDGSNVWEYALKGDYESIISHCVDDVNACREIYKRINFMK